MSGRLSRVLLATLLVAAAGLEARQAAVERSSEGAAEADFLSRVRRLTIEGRRAGEGYWSPDGQRLVFQSEREPGNPFYQIYALDLASGETKRISPGYGKTTCSFFRPGSDQILFASTHHDPKSKALQKEELDFRASGKERRYAWDYDPEFELYALSEKSGQFTRLTNARGYDAEGSYSPDGQWIVYSSNRDAYNRTLSGAEQKQLEIDPSYFAEIYIMRADGSQVRRLTNAAGYDGGPFFFPDGSRIIWRRFDEQGLIADVWTAKPDGTDARQITSFGAMSWAPYVTSVRAVSAVCLEQVGIRELRSFHGRHRRTQGAGAHHIRRRFRRVAGAVARRTSARMDVEPRRRPRGTGLPGRVESRSCPGGASGRPESRALEWGLTRGQTRGQTPT